MSEVTIRTARGVNLQAEVIRPVDCGNRVVIFAHSFLADRHQGGWHSLFAKSYRQAGFATCLFDFSGSGQSDDDVLCVANQVDDLKAVSNWLKHQGLTSQVLHAQGWGALSALEACGYASQKQLIQALVLCAPLLGPSEVNWEQVFSPSQLRQLEDQSHTFIPNDEDPVRDHFIISKQTLRDLSTIDTSQVLQKLVLPTLLVADRSTLDAQWFAPILADPALLGKEQCELVLLQDLAFDFPPDEAGSRAKQVSDPDLTSGNRGQARAERLEGEAQVSTGGKHAPAQKGNAKRSAAKRTKKKSAEKKLTEKNSIQSFSVGVSSASVSQLAQIDSPAGGKPVSLSAVGADQETDRSQPVDAEVKTVSWPADRSTPSLLHLETEPGRGLAVAACPQPSAAEKVRRIAAKWLKRTIYLKGRGSELNIQDD